MKSLSIEDIDACFVPYATKYPVDFVRSTVSLADLLRNGTGDRMVPETAAHEAMAWLDQHRHLDCEEGRAVFDVLNNPKHPTELRYRVADWYLKWRA